MNPFNFSVSRLYNDYNNLHLLDSGVINIGLQVHALESIWKVLKIFAQFFTTNNEAHILSFPISFTLIHNINRA